jgi:hypothetical protein
MKTMKVCTETKLSDERSSQIPSMGHQGPRFAVHRLLCATLSRLPPPWLAQLVPLLNPVPRLELLREPSAALLWEDRGGRCWCYRRRSCRWHC